MQEESQEAKIARIDERTLGIDSKLDKFIDAHEKQREIQEERIRELAAHKNWLAGAIAVVLGLLGKHVAGHQ